MSPFALALSIAALAALAAPQPMPASAGAECGLEAPEVEAFRAGDLLVGWRAHEQGEEGDGRSGRLAHAFDWKHLLLESEGSASWRWLVSRGGESLELIGPPPSALGIESPEPARPTRACGWTPALAALHEADRRALELRAEGRYSQAWTLRGEAMEGHLADAGPTIEALLQREQGWDADEAKDFDAARQGYARAAELWRRLAPESLARADAEHLLGTLLFWLGELEAAEHHLRTGLELRRKLSPGSPAVGRSANNLGLVRRERGYAGEAGELLGESLDILEAHLPGTLLLSKAYINHGAWLYGRGDFAAAADAFRRAKEIREELAPESLLLAVSLNNLAQALETQGDLDQAGLFYEQALDLRLELAPESLDVASSYGNLSRLASRRGELGRAVELARRAYEICRATLPKGAVTARAARTLARALMWAGELEQAEAAAREALALQQEGRFAAIDASETEQILGAVLLEGGRVDEAESHLRRVLEQRRRLAPESAWHADSLRDLANVERARGRAEGELELLLEALAIVEALPDAPGSSADERATAHARYVGWYRRAADLLVEEGRVEEAFELLERARARGWLATLAGRDAAPAGRLVPELEAERRRLGRSYEKTLARLTSASEDAAGWRQLAELRDERRRVAKALRAAAGERLPFPPAGDAPVPDVVPDSSIMLAYSVGEERTLVFVDAGGGLEARALAVTRGELERQIDRLRLLVQKPSGDVGAIRQLGRWLYDALLAPFEAQLEGAERLVLITDGPLHRLPFAVLVTPTDRWLAETTALVHAPSARLLAHLRARQVSREAPRFVAFADPAAEVLPRETNQRSIGQALPSSRREAKAAAGTFPGAAEIFVGEEASEERARRVAPSASVLHFATHSWIDDRFPLDSYLALAATEAENGRWHAFEIVEGLETRAELVTLSGCETGFGRELDGAGLQSLARAFFHAGARSVLASSWRIDDAATASLMTAFYDELGRHDKAEALARAQRRLIAGELERPSGPLAPLVSWARRLWPGGESAADGARLFAHPYYWSGFHLLGDWRGLGALAAGSERPESGEAVTEPATTE